MKRLYLASDNYTNYLIIRDFLRDDDDSAIVNWDLTNAEIDEAIFKFGENPDDTSYFARNPDELEFKPFYDLMSNMNEYETFF